jgi:hypothetical protein
MSEERVTKNTCASRWLNNRLTCKTPPEPRESHDFYVVIALGIFEQLQRIANCLSNHLEKRDNENGREV